MVIPPDTVARRLLKYTAWFIFRRLSPAPAGALMASDRLSEPMSGMVPTPDHRAAIAQYGATQHHRHTFQLLPQPTLFDGMDF